jgi:hypothetical protein
MPALTPLFIQEYPPCGYCDKHVESLALYEFETVYGERVSGCKKHYDIYKICDEWQQDNILVLRNEACRGIC